MPKKSHTQTGGIWFGDALPDSTDRIEAPEMLKRTLAKARACKQKKLDACDVRKIVDDHHRAILSGNYKDVYSYSTDGASNAMKLMSKAYGDSSEGKRLLPAAEARAPRQRWSPPPARNAYYDEVISNLNQIQRLNKSVRATGRAPPDAELELSLAAGMPTRRAPAMKNNPLFEPYIDRYSGWSESAITKDFERRLVELRARPTGGGRKTAVKPRSKAVSSKAAS